MHKNDNTKKTDTKKRNVIAATISKVKSHILGCFKMKLINTDKIVNILKKRLNKHKERKNTKQNEQIKTKKEKTKNK